MDFSQIPEGVLFFATERGILVHQICAGIAKGLWPPSIPEYAAGYVKSFQDWFDAQVKEVFLVEERLYDNVYFLTGQLDLLLKTKTEGVVVVDLKTPAHSYKTWSGQLAAYLHLARTKTIYSPIKKAGSLQLHPRGGTAKMKWYEEHKADWAMYLNKLSADRYFSEKE